MPRKDSRITCFTSPPKKRKGSFTSSTKTMPTKNQKESLFRSQSMGSLQGLSQEDAAVC